MTEAQTNTTASLTRAEIRRRTDALNLRERELTERLVKMYQNGGSSGGPVVSDRDRKVHEGAMRHLNGAAALLKPIDSPDAGEGERDVQLERESVRLALRTLQKADFEAEAIEAAKAAVALTPKFMELQRLWLIAASQFNAVAKACFDFEAGLSGSTSNALPDTWTPMSIAYIEWPRSMYSPCQTVEQVVDKAIAAGAVSRADIARARKVPN
ncbi:MAG: hypothetical protein JWR80_8105 [Bradyrhizobium sp.]|nr:hypothetical protein [Bradyrhizobium sp.]